MQYTRANLTTKVLSAAPQLMAFLSHTAYEDGSSRVPGRLFISCTGLLWRVTLADKDTGLSITVVEGTIDDALALAELQLSSDDPPWEVDPFALDRARAKPKK